MADYLADYMHDRVPAEQHHRITPDSTLKDLGCDDLVPIELALLIEQHTRCDMIPDLVIQRWRTWDDVLRTDRRAAAAKRVTA